MCRHGLYRSNQFIYNDPELCFKRTVPQTALFDASTSQGKSEVSMYGASLEAWERVCGSFQMKEDYNVAVFAVIRKYVHNGV